MAKPTEQEILDVLLKHKLRWGIEGICYMPTQMGFDILNFYFVRGPVGNIVVRCCDTHLVLDTDGIDKRKNKRFHHDDYYQIEYLFDDFLRYALDAIWKYRKKSKHKKYKVYTDPTGVTANNLLVGIKNPTLYGKPVLPKPDYGPPIIYAPYIPITVTTQVAPYHINTIQIEPEGQVIAEF